MVMYNQVRCIRPLIDPKRCRTNGPRHGTINRLRYGSRMGCLPKEAGIGGHTDSRSYRKRTRFVCMGLCTFMSI
jgi:hypothetical protein